MAKPGASSPGATDPEDILDLDAAVERRCAAEGRTAPRDIEARRRLHLDILNERLKGREHLDRSYHHA